MRMLVEAANGALGVEDGRIVSPLGTFDVALHVGDGNLRPGLINAHEHLHRNHYGRLGDPPYQNAHAWGEDIHARCAETIARGRALPRHEALLHGAEKNLRAGVTTVVHHDSWEPSLDTGFPVRVLRIRHAHTIRSVSHEASDATDSLFTIHLAEGTDASSAEEVRDLDRQRLLTHNLLAVHGVGVDADGVRRLRSARAAVVWCPTSNLFLFGRTAPPELLAPGMDVLLGSDSLLTGAGTLLEELRAARALAAISDARLEDAVGPLAARRLGLEQPSLHPGARADFVVLRAPVLAASPADVAVVVAGGRLRVLDPALVPSLGEWQSRGSVTGMDGIARWISLAP